MYGVNNRYRIKLYRNLNKIKPIQTTEIGRILQHFNNQLPHTTLNNAELLKHFKISKTAPTCFSLRGNHNQGAIIST